MKMLLRQKSYKIRCIEKDMKKGISKRGQMTAFIIFAVIIGAIILLFAFKDQVNTKINDLMGREFTPDGYLKRCIEPDLKEEINLIGKQGSYSNLENVGKKKFNSDEFAYLCYIKENYVTCVVQQPMIKTNFEKSLKEVLKPKIEECFNKLKEEYQDRGYVVRAGASNSNVELVPQGAKIILGSDLTVSKEGSSESFEGLEIEVKSEMYDLIYIAKSIVDYESTFGDSETTLYMQYYPDLKVVKTKLSDGTAIYQLSNVLTGEEFWFASRSLAWAGEVA